MRRVSIFEAYSASLMATWGIVLIVPWDTFSTTPAYSVLARIANEEQWGLLALALAGVQVAGMQSNWYIFGYEMRISTLLVAACAWVAIGVLFGLGNPRGHAVVIYLLSGAACFWQAYQLHRERRG